MHSIALGLRFFWQRKCQRQLILCFCMSYVMRGNSCLAFCFCTAASKILSLRTWTEVLEVWRCQEMTAAQAWDTKRTRDSAQKALVQPAHRGGALARKASGSVPVPSNLSLLAVAVAAASSRIEEEKAGLRFETIRTSFVMVPLCLFFYGVTEITTAMASSRVRLYKNRA